MRHRLPETLAEQKPRLDTPYGLAKAANAAGHNVSLSTIYRLYRNGGRVANFSGELLEALCDVFGLGPGALLEHEGHSKAGRHRKRRSA
jgi:hypothetical protein